MISKNKLIRKLENLEQMIYEIQEHVQIRRHISEMKNILQSEEIGEELLSLAVTAANELEELITEIQIPKASNTYHLLLLIIKDIKKNLNYPDNIPLSFSEEALALEQRLIDKHQQFESFLQSSGNYISQNFPKPSCFISYAWASSDIPSELWIQDFVYILAKHLIQIGIDARLDQLHSRYGANMQEFMRGLNESNFVLFVGSRSLMAKLSDCNVRRNVKNEHEIIISRQNEIIAKQGAENRYPVIPILLSGSCEESFGHFAMPGGEIPGASAIEEWNCPDTTSERRKSYYEQFIGLVTNIYAEFLPAERWQRFKEYFEPNQEEFKHRFSAKYLLGGFSETQLRKYSLAETATQNLKSAFENRILELEQELELNCYIESRLKRSIDSEQTEALSEIIPRFMESANQKVLLIQGDSGSGKTLSSIILENNFWRQYMLDEVNAAIPIRVALKYIPNDKLHKIVPYILKRAPYNLSKKKINYLQTTRKIVFIFDGYDEIANNRAINLFQLNQLFAWQEPKLIITCRTQYLTQKENYSGYFIINEQDRYRQSFCEYYIANFNNDEINRYIESFLNHTNQYEKISPYKEHFYTIQGLIEIIQNPFVLRLALEVLPEIVAKRGPEMPIQQRLLPVKKAEVYMLLISKFFTSEEYREALAGLANNISLTKVFVAFSQLLAWENISQGNNSQIFSRETIDQVFFKLENGNIELEEFNAYLDNLLTQKRIGFPIHRVGDNLFSFIHRSIQEFLVAGMLSGLILEYEDINAYKFKVYGGLFLLKEREILNFFAELAENNRTIVNKLCWLISESKKTYRNPNGRVIAPYFGSFAITVLNILNYPFSGQNYIGIKIPFANLNNAICHRTRFDRANLTKVTMDGAFLCGANFSSATMKDVFFGETKGANFNGWIENISLSPNKEVLAISVLSRNSEIILCEALTFRILSRYSEERFSCGKMIFSSDGNLITFNTHNFNLEVLEIHDNEIANKKSILITNEIVSSLVLYNEGAQLIAGDFHGKIYVFNICENYRLLQQIETVAQQVIDDFNPWEEASINLTAIKIEGLVISERKKFLAIAYGMGPMILKIRNLQTLEIIHEIDCEINDGVMVFDQSGNSLAFYGNDGQRFIGILNASDNFNEERRIIVNGPIKYLEYSNNNKLLLAAIGEEIRIFDIEKNYCEVNSFVGHSINIEACQYLHNPEILISGDHRGELKCWVLKNEYQQAKNEAEFSVINYHLPQPLSEKIFLSSEGDGICSWDKKSERCLQRFDRNANQICVNPKIPIIARIDHRALFIYQGHLNFNLCAEFKMGHHSELLLYKSCFFSKSGNLLITSMQLNNGRVGFIIRNVSNRFSILNIIKFPSRNSLGYVAINPDETKLYFDYNFNRKIFVCDINGDNKIRELFFYGERYCANRLSFIVFSNSTKYLLTGCDEGTIKVWDMQSEPYCVKILYGHSDEISTLTFNHTDKYLLSTDEAGVLILWDTVNNYDCLMMIQAHSAQIINSEFVATTNIFVTYDRLGGCKAWKIINTANSINCILIWMNRMSFSCENVIIDDARMLSPENHRLLTAGRESQSKQGFFGKHYQKRIKLSDKVHEVTGQRFVKVADEVLNLYERIRRSYLNSDLDTYHQKIEALENYAEEKADLTSFLLLANFYGDIEYDAMLIYFASFALSLLPSDLLPPSYSNKYTHVNWTS